MNSAYDFSQGKLTFWKGKFSSADEDNLKMGYRTQAVQTCYKIFKEWQNSDIAINHSIIYSNSGVVHTTLIRDNVCFINNAAKKCPTRP